MKIICWGLAFLTIFNSCNNLKIASDKKNISKLTIDYSLAQRINPVYKTLIDSTFDVTIARFNAESHSFTVHKKAGAEEAGLNFDFSKGKFVKKSGIITGYVVTGVGLIATPIAVLSATGGEAIVLFYYWPSDKFEFSTSLSSTLAEKPGKEKNNLVMTGALFSSKANRLKRISRRLGESIYKTLLKLDKQVKKAG